jgi:hypothetical protein
MSILSRAEIEIVDAVSRVFFPDDVSSGAPTIDDAGVIAYIDTFVGWMPRNEQVKLRALLQVVERGYSVTAMSPTATFSRADRDKQSTYLAEWERASSPARRCVFQALRSMISIAYMESPAVKTWMGVDERAYVGMTPETDEQPTV